MKWLVFEVNVQISYIDKVCDTFNVSYQNLEMISKNIAGS